MKKIQALLIMIGVTMLITSCSFNILNNNPLNNNQTETEEYVYSMEHMGTWYGFGTDISSAQFEYHIQEGNADTAYVTINGWGTNSNLAREEIEITFDSADSAKENTDSQHQRIFNFSVNAQGKEKLTIIFVDKATGKQTAQSVEAGRVPDYGEAFDIPAQNTDTTVHNMVENPDERSVFLERYEALSTKTIPDAPQQEMNMASAKLFDEWDLLLNDIYNYLKSTKSAAEFDDIENDELAWINEKEAAIENSRSEFEGGSMAPLVANSTAIEYTKERCYYLISLID